MRRGAVQYVFKREFSALFWKTAEAVNALSKVL